MSSITSHLDRTFAALADPHRRDILERVSQGPATASELAAPSGLTLTGVLKHVRALEDACLVETTKVGRVRWCHLTPNALEPAASWIASRQRLWHRRLDRFQAHVEGDGPEA